MFPVLFDDLGFPVPSYFVFLLVAFAVAILVMRGWARQRGLDAAAVTDLGLLTFVVGILGARLTHVLVDGHFMEYVQLCVDPGRVEWRVSSAVCAEYRGQWNGQRSVCHPAAADCLRAFKFWTGGLTFYGGAAIAVPFMVWFLRREGFPVVRTLDVLSLVGLMALAIGRVGCFLGGCCFGRPTDLFWGVSFPPGSPASLSQWRGGLLESPAIASHAVHPTQLYEAACCMLLAGVLSGVHRRQAFPGQTALLALWGYASLRYVVEFFRADDRGGVGPFSTSQWLGLLILVAVAVLAYRRPWAKASG